MVARRTWQARSFLLTTVLLLLAACASESGGGGEVHALGDPVTVGFNERTDTGARGDETTLEVTVLAVREPRLLFRWR